MRCAGKEVESHTEIPGRSATADNAVNKIMVHSLRRYVLISRRVVISCTISNNLDEPWFKHLNVLNSNRDQPNLRVSYCRYTFLENSSS
jgi:hypothetical protein